LRLFYIYLFAFYSLWVSLEWIGFIFIFITFAITESDIGLQNGLLMLLILGTLVFPGLAALTYPKSLDDGWRIDHNGDVDKVSSDKD
jgi:hypothetical protein